MSEALARNVHNSHKDTITFRPAASTSSMNRDFQIRPAVVLFLLTAPAIVLAVINFQKEREFQIPFDGVWWVEHNNKLSAERVELNGPGAKAGIKEGDQLVAINQDEVKDTAAQVRQMYRV